MTANITRYRVADGREVVLPSGIARSATGDNARYKGGETFDVDDDNPEISTYQRFLRVRVAAGDLVIETRSVPTTAAAGKAGDK